MAPSRALRWNRFVETKTIQFDKILTKIILPLSIPGLLSAGIFAFTSCWNECIYAPTLSSPSGNRTIPVAVQSELVEGDVYHWAR